MKYNKTVFLLAAEWLYLLPTITICKNDMLYKVSKSFAIEFHFLMIHARVEWVKERGADDER